jgi:DNA-binding transcriptional regulator YdaS (Cro superfamily)
MSNERPSKIGMKPRIRATSSGQKFSANCIYQWPAPLKLGVRRATLSDLIHGKASLSPEMALRIEKAFDVSMNVLLRMQAWYDSYTMCMALETS